MKWQDISEKFYVENYLYGYCHIFAMALNKLFGYQIEALWDLSPDDLDEGMSGLVHMYAVKPDGTKLDASGILTDERLEQEYSDCNEPDIRQHTINDIKKMMSTGELVKISSKSYEDVLNYIKHKNQIFEYVNPDEILKNIQFHDELNPKLWINDHLKTDVRKKFIKIVNEFYKFLDLPNLKVEDVIFTGSNCALTFTKYSDLDLHLIVDFDHIQFEDDGLTQKELFQNFFNTKKNLWNNMHNIKIEGYPVEMYVQDIDSPLTATGIYSIMDDKWIKKPKAEKPKFDDVSLVAKTEEYIDEIDELLKNNPSEEEVQQKLDDIYVLRKSGLEKAGEFSIENTVFKALRNLGYLDKLRKYILKYSDDEMSLNEIRK